MNPINIIKVYTFILIFAAFVVSTIAKEKAIRERPRKKRSRSLQKANPKGTSGGSTPPKGSKELTMKKECDHYFSRNSDNSLKPCEFCGVIKQQKIMTNKTKGIK